VEVPFSLLTEPRGMGSQMERSIWKMNIKPDIFICRTVLNGLKLGDEERTLSPSNSFAREAFLIPGIPHFVAVAIGNKKESGIARVKLNKIIYINN
jgi:hypothetical protein